MCRLFGFRSSVESRAHRSLIVAENAMATQASYHSDGWGIGYFIDDDPYLFRTSKGAAQDDSFRRFSEGLRSNTLLVHIRKATVGEIDPINSHPFRYGKWLFAHNGTIFGFEKIKDRLRAEILPVYQRVLFGSTDSETIFYFLLSAMVKRGCSPDGKSMISMAEMVEAQQEAINQIFAWVQEVGEPDAPKINYILTNGKRLFGRRAGLELFIATQKKQCPDAETCAEPNKICLTGFLPRLKEGRRRQCNHLLLSSEPIGEDDIWEEVPEGALVALDEQFQCTVHGPPSPFWITWPDCVTVPKPRENVLPALEHWQLPTASI